MAIIEGDLIDFAAVTATAGASETELRASVSRAYYAAFHALAPFADLLPRSKGCPASLQRMSHLELRERLTEWQTDDVCTSLKQMTATKSTLRRSMEAAYTSRVVADYKIGSDMSLAEAQTQVARVKQILRHSKQIWGEIERAKSSDTSAEKAG